MTSSVCDLHVWPPGGDAPQQVDELVLDWGGPVGDRHHGLTMSSDVRQKEVFSRGTQIRNHRQVSIVDVGELREIAVALGIQDLAPGTIAGGLVADRYGTRAESFPKAAMGLRGITGWVERPGIIRPGDEVRVVLPPGM